MVELAVAMPALAVFAFGAIGFFSGLGHPSVCGIVCTDPPFRNPSLSLGILLLGGIPFILTVLLTPEIFLGRRGRVASGMVCLVLGSATLEANASYLYADFFLSWVGSSYDVLALIITLTFGITSLSLLAVGARLWWFAGERERDFGSASSQAGRPTMTEGIALLVLGGASAILDVEFAGCLSSGPCKPDPLVPLVFPLLVFAVGATLVMSVVWRPGAKVG